MSGADITGLDAFVPQVRQVGAVEVRPLRLRQLPAFSRAVGPVLPFLWSGQIVAAITEDLDALLLAVSVATGIAVPDLPEDPAEFVALAAAVVEVNADFFTRRLLPADMAAGAAIRAVTGVTFPDGASWTTFAGSGCCRRSRLPSATPHSSTGSPSSRTA